MRTVKGPAIFLAQFAGDKAPFDTLDTYGEVGRRTSATRASRSRPGPAHFVDVEKAATSKTYADEVKGTVEKHGIVITELSSHIIGQLVAVHPAYDTLSDGFAIPESARQSQGPPGMGGASMSNGAPRLQRTSVSTRMAPSRARWRGRTSTRSRSGRPGWSKRRSTNWPGAGRRSSTSSTSMASMSATRSIRARICSTARPTRCSSSA